MRAHTYSLDDGGTPKVVRVNFVFVLETYALVPNHPATPHPDSWMGDDASIRIHTCVVRWRARPSFRVGASDFMA